MSSVETKIKSQIDVDSQVTGVRAPFKMYRSQQRRYIRLDISRPIEYTILKNRAGKIMPYEEAPTYKGDILNLSAGGVLIAGSAPVEEGSLLTLRMKLQEVEILENVIGLVKRADSDDEEWLLGIEFVSREYLQDLLSGGEIEMLPPTAAPFEEQVRNILNRYVYNKNVASKGRRRVS